MKYVRVVFAVEESDLDGFFEQLDEFIEEGVAGAGVEGNRGLVQGAYVMVPRSTQVEATGSDWEDRK